MSIHRVRMIGASRLEALHNLLSELERLDIQAVAGVVTIDWHWKNLSATKIEYVAEWKS